MSVSGFTSRWCPLLLMAAFIISTSTLARSARADTPTTRPAPAYVPDPAGFSGGSTEPLFTPNANLTGWPTGTGDPIKGTWKPYAGDKPTVEEVAKVATKGLYSINLVWMLVCGFMVMFMQAGFALLETGLCRAKNAAHTMWMNFMVYALGITGFFFCGYALMCGGANGTAIGGPGMLGGIPGNADMCSVGSAVTVGSVTDSGWGLFGKTGFCLTGKSYDGMSVAWFLFMMVFMDTTATIPTGALAERWSSKSFFYFSLAIGAFIYPIYGCWIWGGGWLSQLGYRSGLAHGVVDFAGSSVVHLQGGALAFITCLLLGPRIGKYDANGKPRPILGHHMPMVMLGTFILAFGWFGFNAGSSLAGTDGRIGVAATNTMLASAAGALTSCVYMWMRFGKPDPSMCCNGMLAALVAITACSGYVAPWAAFLIGGISGVLGAWSVFFIENIGIDDPVGAISVHGVNGAWGMLALGLFADGTYGAGKNAVGFTEYLGVAGKGVTGLFYGDSKQFFAQAIGVATCVAWNVAVGGLVFFIIGKTVGNRVPADVEIAGLDLPEVGAPGYPEFIEHLSPEQISASEVMAARAELAGRRR